MQTETAEWVDQHCWRCGSEDPVPASGGRLLCGPCLAAMLTPEPPNGRAAITRLGWESHPLERCWRCMTRAVDPEEDLGLCVRCRNGLRRRGGLPAGTEDRPHL